MTEALRGHEGRTMLAQNLDDWIAEANRAKETAKEDGILIGRREGRKEGMQNLVIRVLSQRFSPLPDEVLEQIRGIRSESRLSALVLEAMAAEALEEVDLGASRTAQ